MKNEFPYKIEFSDLFFISISYFLIFYLNLNGLKSPQSNNVDLVSNDNALEHFWYRKMKKWNLTLLKISLKLILTRSSSCRYFNHNSRVHVIFCCPSTKWQISKNHWMLISTPKKMFLLSILIFLSCTFFYLSFRA